MVFVKQTENFKDINFLLSADINTTTTQVSSTTPGATGGVLPAGSIVPKNDATAIGVTVNDVDVSNGPQPVAVIINGHILAERLPVAPTTAAANALKQISFHNADKSIFKPTTA